MDIKGTIKKHGYSQVDVANALGITRGAFNKTVHNENTSINMLRKIAGVIGCSVSEFFEDEAEVVVQNGNSITCPMCGEKIPLEVNIKK